MLERIARLTGLPSNAAHPSEQLAATFGGLIGIFIVLACTTWMLGPAAAIAIVPSMGASAVLVFAIPHSVFAQPWAVLVSHIVSAIVGVACYKLIPNPIFAAALAVALAIGAMHLTRSMHPPGGATALAAVIGGPAIHALGFNYVIFPVAINSLLMLLAAVLYNNLFPWRRYPLHRMPFITQPKQNNRATVDDAALHSAMSKLKVMIDIDQMNYAHCCKMCLIRNTRKHAKPYPKFNWGVTTATTNLGSNGLCDKSSMSVDQTTPKMI